MDGVAYTTGIELDNDHKQIHFSCDYIASRKSELKAREIMGVLVHEMVHAWQWNGQDQAPGGLIEGIADFVRLKAGLDPPHWKREQAEKWDQGYQHTAYFLEWIETKYGQGSVRRINDGLKDAKYDEGDFWRGLFESSVNDLWEKYKAYLEDTLPGKRSESDQENIEPSMEDTKFWNLVREREGGEKSVVMKAIWRTNRHNPEGSDREIGSIGEQLDSLWSEYLKARLES
ncbi:uncharacterized protein KY384_008697 [Bacidia gigantensis]|uniref:uncharacterized protein n=1 Tax=Bacidia gigantensis TaxID=2732470 RepID=UPI001D058E8C|nr:uncharacterized protein KY384_008697 [Bacidia gigantensis]KAG8526497.1 hypothetical protein KY384_008697 [Bacidia gigantensis]